MKAAEWTHLYLFTQMTIISASRQKTSSYSPSKLKTHEEQRVQTTKVVFMRSLLIVGYYLD